MATTKVEGFDKLKRKMRAFPTLSRQAIEQALEQNAEELVELARRLVPIEDGALRASIGWTLGAPPEGSMVLGQGAMQAGSANIRLTIFAGNRDAFYARWVEFGTRPHVQGGRFAGTQHPGTRATGFFFGSYRTLRRRMRGRITRAIRNAARKAAAGG